MIAAPQVDERVGAATVADRGQDDSGNRRSTPASRERARVRAERAARRTVGPRARLISWSKSSYRRSFPHHLVLFNAQLLLMGDDQRFWEGDLDITLDEPRLRELATRLRRPFRATPEGWVGEWVAVFRPNGRVALRPSWGTRSRAGIIVRASGLPKWAA